jgi:predicted nuclease with RNAse H fold
MRNNEIDAVGIDAPLFWARAGDRAVDQELRNAIHQRGCPTPGGTVQSVNSLRGACLIQGMLVAMMCQEQIAHKFLITEAHPKALLWLLGKSTAGHGPNNIALTDLYGYIGDRAHGATDHERDAVLGALTAFAMHSRQFGWRDIYGLEAKPITTLNPPPSYWMPM